MPRCAACNASIEYTVEDLCGKCKAWIMEYNSDLHNAEETDKPILEPVDKDSSDV